MSLRTAPRQSDPNPECLTDFPTQVKTTRPNGRALPLWLTPAHSRPEPPDHVLGPAAGDGTSVRTAPYDRPCQQVTAPSPGRPLASAMGIYRAISVASPGGRKHRISVCSPTPAGHIRRFHQCVGRLTLVVKEGSTSDGETREERGLLCMQRQGRVLEDQRR
jgi:hypothetical protein